MSEALGHAGLGRAAFFVEEDDKMSRPVGAPGPSDAGACAGVVAMVGESGAWGVAASVPEPNIAVSRLRTPISGIVRAGSYAPDRDVGFVV